MKTQTKVNKILSASAVRQDIPEGARKQWEHEVKSFTTGMATALDNAGVDPKVFEGLARYAMQKARKLAKVMAGEADRIDPATTTFLQCAYDAFMAKVPFTPKMQFAALTKDIDEGDELKDVAKLKHRGVYSRGTANSQKNTSAQALIALGMADRITEEGVKQLKIDFDNPTIRTILKLEPSKVA
jgi:hypothetical protein